MKFDHQMFISLYEAQYGALDGSQASGIDALIGFLEQDTNVSDVRWAAYMLATTKHECADTWQPIEEFGMGQGQPYGNPVTVTDGNGSFANSDGQQRPDVVPGVKATSKPCIPGTFFNTCAFQNPALGSLGNVGINTLEGPSLKNVDFALLKTIPLGESRHIEFRAEAFNTFNHPNFQFAAPGPQNSINSTVMGTAQFGYLTGALAPRQLQLALKLYY